jgi:outer membrane protein assembly factor BamB
MDPLLVEDGVVVLEQNDRLSSNRLIGISAADGSDVWERRMRDQSFSGVLAGTSLLVNIDDDESTATTFHSPATGEPVGSVDGDVSTTDLDGTWYFTTDSTLEQVDLSEGWTEPAGTAQIRDAGGQQIVPVDGSLITIDGTGRLAEVGSEGNLTMLRADDVPPIDAMWPSGGRTFVGVGDGKVVGVELLREAAVLRWQRDGAVRQFGLTGGGLLLVVGDPETDAERLVVDATTGDELTSFRTGATGGGAVQFTSDGFVASPNGSDHEAFDSVGSRLWRLEDAGQLAVGDGLVVSLANTPSGFRLTGYHG